MQVKNVGKFHSIEKSAFPQPYKARLAVETEGATHSEAARVFGRSTATIRRARQRIAESPMASPPGSPIKTVHPRLMSWFAQD